MLYVKQSQKLSGLQHITTLKQLFMKKINLLLIAFLVATLSSCQVIGGIAKISFTAGIVIALIVVFLVVWAISAFRGKN